MKVIQRLKSLAKRIKGEVKAIYVAFKYKKLPIAAKVSAGVTIAYALSPIDLIPDFIPILGYLDDLIILPLLITLTIRLIPTNLMIESRSEAETLWNEGWPKKWRYGIFIIIIWIFILIGIFIKWSN